MQARARLGNRKGPEWKKQWVELQDRNLVKSGIAGGVAWRNGRQTSTWECGRGLDSFCLDFPR